MVPVLGYVDGSGAIRPAEIQVSSCPSTCPETQPSSVFEEESSRSRGIEQRASSSVRLHPSALPVRVPSPARRSLDGRYAPPGLLNGGISKHREKNRRHRMKRKDLMERLFEGYIRVFFVKGERRDWVPHSSRSGPFVSVFENIFKDPYKLGKNERSAILRQVYLRDGRICPPTEIARVSVKNPSLPDATSSRLKIYRYRRLPSVTREISEMRPLVQWLKKVEEHGALVGTWEEAHQVCLNAIASYKYTSEQEAGYVGFPSSTPARPSSVVNSPHRQGERSSEGEACPHPNLQVENGRSREAASEGNSDFAERVSTVLNENSATLPARDVGADDGTERIVEEGEYVHSETNGRILVYMTHYLDLVQCDDLFMALCMLFDGRLNAMFHVIVGAFRQKHNRRSPQVPYLVRVILDYSLEKVFGVKDRRKHEERETVLRSARDNFAVVRGVLGYDEMSWNFP